MVGRLFGFSLCVFLLLVSPMLQAQDSPFGDVTLIGPTRVGSTAPGEGSLVAIDGAWVNVRSGPGTENKVLKTLSRGTQGKILQEKNGWFLIDFGNGLNGWVRGDLVGAGTGTTPHPANANASLLAKEFARWDRHLGSSFLSFDKFPSFWGLGKAWKSYQSGDFQKAYDLAQSAVSNPVEAKYLMARCLFGLGKFEESQRLLASIRKPLEDQGMLEILDGTTKPYIDEGVVFKFGGFDSLDTYRAKVKAGNPIGLESGEYYEKYVDLATWKWKSPAVSKEFDKIAGLDCSGFIQRVEKDMFKLAGVSYPISGRTSTRGLWSGKFTKQINPGVKPPPPPDIRPGDMILLDYGHNRYGHSLIFRGVDSKGNIRVAQMGDTAQEAILTAEHYQYFKGAYRMNGMDKVRQKLLA